MEGYTYEEYLAQRGLEEAEEKIPRLSRRAAYG